MTWVLAPIVAVALAGAYPSGGGEADRRPNVVLVLADDMGTGDLQLTRRALDTRRSMVGPDLVPGEAR